MDFDLEELAAIFELLDGADFTEFRLEKGDLRLVVRRGAVPQDSVPAQDTPVAPLSVPETLSRGPQPPMHDGAPRPAPTNQAPAPAGPAEDVYVVRSPMLGAAYGAPKPGEPPFVAIGDHVVHDTVICVLEVMKLMNSVSAGATGEVVAIYFQDGELVEYDAPLLGLRLPL